MDAEPEAYRDVFTASAEYLTARRRRIEATDILTLERIVGSIRRSLTGADPVRDYAQ